MNTLTKEKYINTPNEVFSRERGGAIIETLIVLPLLLFVTFGIFDYSRYLHTYWAFQHAAKEGVYNMSRLQTFGGEEVDPFTSGSSRLEQYSNCFATWSTGSEQCKHIISHWLTSSVLDSMQSWDDTAERSIVTKGNTASKVAEVQIKSKYYPLIDIFNIVSFEINCVEKARFFDNL